MPLTSFPKLPLKAYPLLIFAFLVLLLVLLSALLGQAKRDNEQLNANLKEQTRAHQDAKAIRQLRAVPDRDFFIKRLCTTGALRDGDCHLYNHE